MIKHWLYYLSFIFLAACSSNKPVSSVTGIQETQQFHEGIRAYLKGDYNLALAAIDNVMALNPNHDGALYLKSKIFFDQGDFLSASDFLLKAQKADPKNAYIATEVGYMYSVTGRFKEAGATYEQLIAPNPNNKENYFGAFENYLKGKEFKSAKRVVDLQVRAFGETLETYLNRYKICLSSGDKRQAILELEKGLSAFPHEPLFLASLIDEYFDSHQDEKAIPLLEQLCKSDPENGVAKLIYGDYLIRTGEIDRGNKMLREAVLLEGPSIEQKSEVLLSIQQQSGCTPENRDLFEQFAILYPEELIGHTLLGDLYTLCNAPFQALKEYKAAVSINPSAFPVWKQILLIHYREEQWDSLENNSQICLSLFPSETMPYLTDAIAKNKKGMYAAAKESINLGRDLIVSDAATEAEFLFQDGYIALKSGKINETRDLFDQAISIHPSNTALKADVANELLNTPAFIGWADSLINDCLKLEPNNGKYIAIKGRVYFYQSEVLLAIAWIEKAILNGYPAKLGEEWLGDCEAQLGKQEKAKKHWQAAFELGNQSERLQLKLQP